MKIIYALLLVFGFFCPELYGQWTLQTNTNAIFSLSAVDNDIVWGCGISGTVIRTTNGGSQWTSVGAAPVNGTLNNIFAVDAGTALATATDASSIVWKTTNGGTTWSQVFEQADGFINGIHINTNGTGFMTGDPVDGRWSLWKTTNFGTTWDSSGMYLPQNNFEFGFGNSLYVNGNTYWFGTYNNGRMYYSTNSGASWSPRVSGITAPVAIWFNGSTGIVGGGSTITPGVIKSTNSGTNWTSVTVPGTGAVSGINGTGSLFWLAKGNTIYKSTNSGLNWISDYTTAGLSNHLTRARTGSRLWTADASGNIYRSEGLVSVSPISSAIARNYSLFQNYPNPFNPSTKIKFEIPAGVSGAEQIVKLSVYSISGKQIAVLINEKLHAGIYEYTFDGQNLATGVYYYRLESGNFNETKKMILIK